MKKKFVAFVALLLLCIGAFACNVTFLVNGQAKYDKEKIYAPGEEIQVTITIAYIHNPCLLELSDTKLKLDGLDLVKEGEWIENANGSHSKVVTLKVQQDYKKDCKLTLTRTCTNQGGFGMLKFKHS